ncbi:hypothetical protein ABZX85_00140 [Streptomyces sp. NPDC004539]|uniref:hypothetical protein n=1 Tax=Streptomyces sp. NPDC004539 TaxID=3154280 RepID=UPI0033A22F1F
MLARRGKDGRLYGALPCAWCEAPIVQDGRRRVRRYCRGWHRVKRYVTSALDPLFDLFAN